MYGVEKAENKSPLVADGVMMKRFESKKTPSSSSNSSCNSSKYRESRWIRLRGVSRTDVEPASDSSSEWEMPQTFRTNSMNVFSDNINGCNLLTLMSCL
jgi:hypothetical protein